MHQFDLEGPFQSLRVHVEGEVDTMDAAGVVRGAAEMFPPSLFVRETPLTAADDALRAFAADLGPVQDPLSYLHALTNALHEQLRFEVGATQPSTTAAQAFALGRGVCQDFAHIFIAAARSRGLPARYVSGYLARSDGVTLQDASHAWAEAFMPHLGWVGFDPANGVSPTERYVRVAGALDYLGAAPILGARQGGGLETLGVRLSVDTVQRQSQS
jgi:transglutaminase-like putative cysteine protease